jgi:hypothetical protein
VGVAACVVLLFVEVFLLVRPILVEALLQRRLVVVVDDLDNVVVRVLVLRLVAEEVLHHLVPCLLLDIPLPVAARHRRRRRSSGAIASSQSHRRRRASEALGKAG